MLPHPNVLRAQLRTIIVNKREQGHVTDGLDAELQSLPNSYDALAEFARKLAHLPLRADWPHVEPDDLDEIWAECDPERPLDRLAPLDGSDVARRIETAFVSSVCGCMLGKPVEVNPTLAELRDALEKIGDWPLRDYVSEKLRDHFPRPLHASWITTTRERMTYASPDDDVNYTVLGMLVLEEHGIQFSKPQLARLWLEHLPVSSTFGPERTTLLKMGLNSLHGGGMDDPEEWPVYFNAREEWCGAMIRADAYGYACAGRPALAAALAWRDSSLTHRRTGIYGTMFASAAIAAAPVTKDPLRIFEVALQFVPRRSRFHHIVSDSLQEVASATDWLDGYHRIHRKYAHYTHCLVFQETGTLINTLRFAENIGDGLCKQVAQGNDTDSYGATAGSILGAYFGPGHLEARWTEPLQDDLRTTLAAYHERSISATARRMAKLPQLVERQVARASAVRG